MNATAIATRQQNTALVSAEQQAAMRTALKNSLYPGASEGSIDLVLSYCQATNLDPMTKPVHIVPMTVSTGEKDANGWDIKEKRDVVMPGIGLYRTLAARTGAYAGCSEPEFGTTKTLKFKREKWEGSGNNRRKTMVDASMEYPEWCRITIRKILGGEVYEFTALEYWVENYATKGDEGAPNAMWEKRPFGQLAKCAEAQALRKAFPEAVGSQPTAEEMDGKDIIDGTATVVQTERVAMPQAKQSPQSAATSADDAGGVAAATGDSESPAAGAPAGIHGLSVSMLKTLKAKAKNAGLFTDAGELDEPALLKHYPSITTANINDVLEGLRKIAEAQDAG